MGDRRRRPRKPLLMRLPYGLREQPAWVFVGILIGLAGLSYVTGFTESSVSNAIGPTGLRIWGGVLTVSGFSVVGATLRSAPAFEKFALRMMSTSLLVYIGWLWTVVELRRLAMSIALVGVLVVLAEIRIAVIKALLRASAQTWP